MTQGYIIHLCSTGTWGPFLLLPSLCRALPLCSLSFLRFLPARSFSLQIHMNLPSTMPTILPSLVSTKYMWRVYSVCHPQKCSKFWVLWFQNWIRILQKHQRSKLSPLAPKDAVRRAWSGLMCYILGAVHLPKTNTSTHKLRFVLPLLLEIRVVIITTPKLSSRSLDCRHLTSESRILLLSDGSSQQNWWSSGCF